ncbi:battenin-like [Narcine bancroftii]|uniref:battenin-like n=1 Tax=Narcine bancroftii TaxID=1343680 RepID=UPI003831910D
MHSILLADILPTLLIKFCSPFVIQLFPYGYRVLFCCLSAITSFLVISFSIATWMSLLGVVFASISSGLGEYTFLSLTAHFQPSVICAWSSGTGAAGLLGAVSYSGLTQTGLSPRNTMQLMVVFPVVEWISYYCLLALPPTLPNWRLDDPDQILHDPDWTLPNQDQSLEDQPLISSNNPGNNNAVLTLSQKMKIIKNSLKYTIPLGLVYFAEYFINQGLFELLYFQKSFLNHSEQYRWYQTTYQAGVFISRSSRTCIHIRRIWVISILQFVNLLFLLFVAWYSFLPSIWIMFAIILYEGLLGGAGYVNAFNNIRDEVDDDDITKVLRQFSLVPTKLEKLMQFDMQSFAASLPDLCGDSIHTCCFATFQLFNCLICLIPGEDLIQV